MPMPVHAVTDPPAFAGVDVRRLIRELIELRRGRGLLAPDIDHRVGPLLRRVLGVRETDDAPRVRSEVSLGISEALTSLPADLRLAARAALAIEPEARRQFLNERMAWLGARLDRDSRTAIRRVDAAFQLLAEQLVQQPPVSRQLPGEDHAPHGWYVERATADLLLDRDPVQLLESRRIVSTIQGLDRIIVALTLPRRWSVPASNMGNHATMVHGGALTAQCADGPSGHQGRGTIQFPRPLNNGEAHDYGIAFTSLRPRSTWPYYLLTPSCRFDTFVLRARFDRLRMPARIRRLEGVPANLVQDCRSLGEPVEPDAVGEVQLEFSALRQGLGYGVRWWH
jgi:hypothetical protein